MKVEVKENMYIRKSNGIIYKIPESSKWLIDIYNKNNCSFKKIEENSYDTALFGFFRDIKKSSFNIIDLVEYMDLVTFNESIKVISHKGEEYAVSFLEPQFIEGFTTIEDEDYIMIGRDRLAKISDLTNDKIKAVKTREKLAEIEYRVEEIV